MNGAKPISPEVWNKAAIEDNRLLPARYSIGIFTGKGVNIANNSDIYAFDEILVSDRIFDYDDRRLNGLANPGPTVHGPGGGPFNADGRDGWGASAYGPFQSVRFARRVFTSGQHKSIAWRIFDEKQYGGAIGHFGDGTTSTAYTGGENYLSTAETINKAKSIWDSEILGPHIDRYNFFAIANGHISGRFVQRYANQGQMFDGEGQWIASPGPYVGLPIPPEFAPIKAVEWDSLNVRPLLNAINVAWTNLFIPQDNRVILMDGAYRDDLLSQLIGSPGSVPATEKAFDALTEGRFERFYGWDFDFTIPTQYFPKVYLDANNNVVRSPDGTAAFDLAINSINAPEGVIKLQTELAASMRTRATNFFGTIFDENTGTFKNIVTNHGPIGPAGAPYLGIPESHVNPSFAVHNLEDFPWQGFPGQGIAEPTGPVGPIVRRQVIGMAVYRPAAQLGEEYGHMETARGGTRGKFTELVFDVKHDAWVLPQFAHGILLIVDSEQNVGTPAIPVKIVDNTIPDPQVTGISAFPEGPIELVVSGTAAPTITVEGVGPFDRGWTAVSDNPTVASVGSSGQIRGLAVGAANITFTSVGDPGQSVVVAVTVGASPPWQLGAELGADETAAPEVQEPGTQKPFEVM